MSVIERTSVVTLTGVGLPLSEGRVQRRPYGRTCRVRTHRHTAGCPASPHGSRLVRTGPANNKPLRLPRSTGTAFVLAVFFAGLLTDTIPPCQPNHLSGVGSSDTKPLRRLPRCQLPIHAFVLAVGGVWINTSVGEQAVRRRYSLCLAVTYLRRQLITIPCLRAGGFIPRRYHASALAVSRRSFTDTMPPCWLTTISASQIPRLCAGRITEDRRY
jgi:hypothetical protein